MNKHTFLICLALGNSNIDKVCTVIHQFVTKSCNGYNKKIQRKIVNIFLPINFNKCFGCSKEPSH